MDLLRKYSLPVALTAALFITGCTDNEEAEQEAEALSERTEEAIERDPATETPAAQTPQQIPPPENVAAPPEDAQSTANGVAYIVLEDQATDVSPSEADVVTVHYTGWLTDGTKFDSSVDRGQPAH